MRLITDRLHDKEIERSACDRLAYYHYEMLRYGLRPEAEADEVAEHYQTQARQTRLDIIRLREPWLPEMVAPSKADVVQTLTEGFVEAFGDPNSPEYLAEEQRLLDFWASGEDEDENSALQMPEPSLEELRKLGFTV